MEKTMPIRNFTPYIFLNGTAESAIALYERAFGATLEGMQRYSDLPPGSNMCPPENTHRIMHAMVTIASAKLMLSDRPVDKPESDSAPIEIVAEFDDLNEMERSFRTLAESGKVGMDLHDAFWGDRFGTVADEFGVHWMFTCPTAAR